PYQRVFHDDIEIQVAIVCAHTLGLPGQGDMAMSHSGGSGDIQEPVQGVWPTQDAIRYWLHRAIGIARRLQGQSPVKDQLDQFRVDIQINAAGLDPTVNILLRIEISSTPGVLLGRDLLAAMVLACLTEL